MESKALLTIGKITGVHGLGGNLKVRSFAESADTFAVGTQIRLEPENFLAKGSNDIGQRISAGNVPTDKPFIIVKSSIQKKGVLLSLEGVDNRNLAEELIGYNILIHRDALPELEKDTWYWEDLYGLEVMDESRGLVGEIERIFDTGASDVLVVKHPDTGQETLIPMHRHFIQNVDIESRTVLTQLPEGL